jgi:hypothetical protein
VAGVNKVFVEDIKQMEEKAKTIIVKITIIKPITITKNSKLL